MMDCNKIISTACQSMKPSGIRRFFSIAAEMPECISLGIGEPDFVTPLRIREAGIASLRDGITGYTSNAGLEELNAEVAQYMKRKYNLSYGTDQTLVTVGGSEAIDMCIRALINPGDEVILPMPCYVCYEPIVHLCGGVVVPVPLQSRNSFRLTAEELKAAITPKTKLLILMFPSNPTGAVMHRQHLEELAAVLEGTDIAVLSDELYAELTYTGERHVSIAEISPEMHSRTVVVNGFSKAFAMTGWRLGFACGPAEIIAAMYKIHQYAIMCAPTTSQYAAIVALRECDDDVQDMMREYDRRRQFVTARFNGMGLPCFEPEGAFYVFPSVASTGMKSLEFCERLLYTKNVAVVPGDSFGDCGEGFVRVCYAYSIEHLTEALNRIEEFLEEL